MNVVDFLNLKSVHEELRADLIDCFTNVLDSGQFVGGDAVSQFESEFAAYSSANHCVGVANGLDALVLALKALEIGEGDEVIVPSHTFIATWLAVRNVGAKIVPVEPAVGSFLIDPEQIEAAITSKTKAILPVHLYGMPADLDHICSIAKKYQLFVIEDAAQAHGARYKGERIGAHGDIVCWSFYPGKNLGALGDGGAITTNNPQLAKRVQMLGNYGSSQKYIHELVGVNSRLDPVQAKILSYKLKLLDDFNAKRQTIADQYLREIKNFELPALEAGCESVWHLFVIRTNKREQLARYLSSNNIQTLIHYPIACHKSEAFSDLQNMHLPVCEKYADEVLSLPMGPHMSEDDVKITIDCINRFEVL